MNETSKAEIYRNFKTTLLAVAAQIGAVATRKPSEGAGVWHITAMDDKAIKVEITYTHYDYNGDAPALYVGPGMRQKKLTNLTAPNLKKHLIKHLSAARSERAEIALQDAQDDYSATAEKRMAEFIDTLLPDYTGFKRGTSDIDNPVWESERGWFKLAHVHVIGTVGKFETTYNIEYDLHTGPGREIHVRGEFDAVTSAQVARTIDAIRNIA